MAINVVNMTKDGVGEEMLLAVLVTERFSEDWVRNNPFPLMDQHQMTPVSIDMVFVDRDPNPEEGTVVSWALASPDFTYWVVLVPSPKNDIHLTMEAMVHELVHVFLKSTHDYDREPTEEEEEYVRQAVEEWRKGYA